MYQNGQLLHKDIQFQDHCDHQVPIQIYHGRQHSDIGYVEKYSEAFVKVNNVFYNRRQFTFVSRPGY